MNRLSRRKLVRSMLLLGILALFVATGAGFVDIGAADPVAGPLADPASLSAVRVKAAVPGAILVSAHFLVLVGVGLVLALLLPVLTPIQASLLTLAGMVPIAYLGYTAVGPAPPLPMEFSLLTVLMLFAVNVLASYFEENSTKQRLVSLFGQYVPPELARMINEDPDSFSLEGEAREMTIMFCDIRDFTTLSESLEPTQVVALLNRVFTPLTRVICDHRGTIDKYLGDGVMAFWGAPARDPAHAGNAVRAALAMQRRLEDLRGELAREGLPEVRMGIGLSSGVVNVGNMGSEFRVAYTVVGDAVNEASRLEALTRALNTDIVVNEAVRQRARGVVFRELATVRLKGRQQVTRAYQPMGLESELGPEEEARLEAHRAALESFYARRWDEAVSRFGRLWEQSAPDNRLYELYLQNISRFTAGPRPFDWQGELDLRIDPLFAPDEPRV